MSTPITLTGAYTCTHHNDSERTACPVCLVSAITAERDQLRAEVERLETDYADYAFWKDAAKTRANHLESASQQMLAHEHTILQLRAELALLREWQREVIQGVIQNAIAHHAERKDAIARAERAEAELAKERARLDWLDVHGYLLDQFTHGASKPHPDDYWICTDGERTGEGATPRAAIDTAMKEGAK